MPTTSRETIRWVAHQIAARALTRQADDEMRDRLAEIVRTWFPDTREVPDDELRDIARTVAIEFQMLAASVEARCLKYVQMGAASPIPRSS